MHLLEYYHGTFSYWSSHCNSIEDWVILRWGTRLVVTTLEIRLVISIILIWYHTKRSPNIQWLSLWAGNKSYSRTNILIDDVTIWNHMNAFKTVVDAENVCLSVCLPACLSVCLYACMHACMHTYIHIYVHVHVHVYAYSVIGIINSCFLWNCLHNYKFQNLFTTMQIWGIWKLRPAYSPKTPNLGKNRWCFEPCDLEIWWMTLENNRASLLCCFKLWATFHSHWWIETGVIVPKRPIWVKFDDF